LPPLNPFGSGKTCLPPNQAPPGGQVRAGHLGGAAPWPISWFAEVYRGWGPSGFLDSTRSEFPGTEIERHRLLTTCGFGKRKFAEKRYRKKCISKAAGQASGLYRREIAHSRPFPAVIAVFRRGWGLSHGGGCTAWGCNRTLVGPFLNSLRQVKEGIGERVVARGRISRQVIRASLFTRKDESSRLRE